MCEAGRIRHHLKHNLWNPKSSVIFVGYQAEGTLGRFLLEGAQDVKLFGEDVHVNAKMHTLEGMSGHADMEGLLAWVRGFVKKPKQFFLVHGEEESKRAFAETVREETGNDCIVVNGLSEYELQKDAVLTRGEAVGDAMDKDALEDIKVRISRVHGELENILYTTHLAMSDKTSAGHLAEIMNIVLELEKNSINLGSALTREDAAE
jgi:metallo-beta-lactamase family protein